MIPRPDEVRLPGAEAGGAAEPDVPAEYQPESGALGPREAAPDEDDGTEPGDDL